MRINYVVVSFLFCFVFFLFTISSHAETNPVVLEQSMSETLDLWREGRFDQVYERLAHRGRISKEQFVNKMRETTIRPSCCFQKMQNFKVLSEKRTEAIVYVKIGLEGTSNPSESSTREFKLSHDAGGWKMQLSDITSLAGVTAKKGKHGSRSK